MNQFLHHYRLNHDHQQNENHLHLLNKNHMIRYHHHQIKNQIYVKGKKKKSNQIKTFKLTHQKIFQHPLVKKVITSEHQRNFLILLEHQDVVDDVVDLIPHVVHVYQHANKSI